MKVINAATVQSFTLILFCADSGARIKEEEVGGGENNQDANGKEGFGLRPVISIKSDRCWVALIMNAISQRLTYLFSAPVKLDGALKVQAGRRDRT